MPVRFVGPSYQLASRTADVQRSVNLYPVPIESGSGSSSFMLQSVPGLVAFCSTATGQGRGCYSMNGRAFFVAGSTFYELLATGTSIARGTLAGATTTQVSIDSNTTQAFIADGARGYVFNLDSNLFFEATGVAEFGGSRRTAYLDQYAIWAPPGSAFYISSLGSAGTIDPLDFASAEAMPDEIVSFVVANRQLYLFGSSTTEIWLNTGAADFPLQRYDGTVMGVGCIAPYSAQVCNGIPVWLGSSKDGIGSVWMANGYTPQRISTRAIEESLAESSDLPGSYAYTWNWQGSAFYCLRVPDLDTTFVYDFLSQSWHEQAEFVSGQYQQHRASCAMVAFGKVLVVGDDGIVYEVRSDAYSNAGDVLCRDRISPHDIQAGERQFFAEFIVAADAGVTGEVMLRMSNDGGASWGDWRRRSLGALGKRKQRIIWARCGSARDRVWQVRCTDAVPFSIVDAAAR